MPFFADYIEYFSAARNDKIVTISLIKELPESILLSQSFIVLTLAASTDENADLIGYTVVVISLPETKGSTEIGKTKIC